MALFEGGGMRGRDDPPHPAYWAKYHLTEQEGKAVQEILNRYKEELEDQCSELLADVFLDGEGLTRQHAKDIDYITGLAKLFDQVRGVRQISRHLLVDPPGVDGHALDRVQHR